MQRLQKVLRSAGVFFAVYPVKHHLLMTLLKLPQPDAKRYQERILDLSKVSQCFRELCWHVCQYPFMFRFALRLLTMVSANFSRVDVSGTILFSIQYPS
jgi:hypothetical protein